jgi:thymidylate synthase
MMIKQPLFPLVDTPDVDLEQAGGTNVAVDKTFAAAERIQLDSTSRAAITSAVDIVTSGRSNSRPCMCFLQ